MPKIQPVDIVAPGSKGLNTERSSTLLNPLWAITATNAVVNRDGRIAARKGWANQTTTAITGTHDIDVIHEYLNEAGTSVILSTANNKIYKNITDFSDAANDITSSTAPTADHWQFINFNDFVLGYQRGHTPIQWQGSGDFSDQFFTGTGPDGNCAVAAFGRVWAADADLQTIRYSALLDHDDFSTANGGGTIDMTSVWTNGMDQIVALAAIGASLVVFGKNHLVMWSSGGGTELGLDPSDIEVVDTIEGTGCIARDSVTVTGEGDIIFLSRHGVQSLTRVIQSKSNPLAALSKNVRSLIMTAISTQKASDAQLDEVRATHSPEEGLYIINFPRYEKMFVFDTQHPFQDEDGEIVFPVTVWEVGGDIKAVTAISDGSVYFGSAGIVGAYEGNDDNGSDYTFTMSTGWIDFGPLNHRLKILKEIIGTVVIGGSSDLSWTWEFDFNGEELSRTTSYTGSTTAQFGEGEFNIAEFSGGVTIQRRTLPAFGEGQFIRLGVTAAVSGFDVVVQQISIAPAIGRMVS